MRFQILFSLALAAVAIAASPAEQASNQIAARQVADLNSQVYDRDANMPARARKFGNALDARKTKKAPDGLLQKVGLLVAGLEKALGVTALEDALDKVLPLKPIEDSLGLTKLEESLDLLKGCSPDGVLQYVGKLVKYLEDKLGVTALEDALNKTLGGGLYALEDALGLTKLLQGLDLE